MSYLKRLTNAALGRLQAFRMYGGIGMSASSLHRESTDSLIYAAQFWNIPVTILKEGDQVTLQLFDDPLDPRYRLIPAEPAPRTMLLC